MYSQVLTMPSSGGWGGKGQKWLQHRTDLDQLLLKAWTLQTKALRGHTWGGDRGLCLLENNKCVAVSIRMASGPCYYGPSVLSDSQKPALQSDYSWMLTDTWAPLLFKPDTEGERYWGSHLITHRSRRKLQQVVWTKQCSPISKLTSSAVWLWCRKLLESTIGKLNIVISNSKWFII